MRRHLALAALTAAVAAVSACGAGGTGSPSFEPGRHQATTGVATETSPASATSGASLEVTSPDFPGGTIPRAFTCDGGDRTPHLRWRPALDHGSVVVEVVDPDAPSGHFVHWLLAGPASALPGSVGPDLPPAVVVGRNDFGSVGYRGPCPPAGPAHHYRFVVTILDRPDLPLTAGFRVEEAADVVAGSTVLARGELVATYGR